MRYNQLGNTGLFVSEICLGTMTFGSAEGAFWGGIAGVDMLYRQLHRRLGFDRGRAQPDGPGATRHALDRAGLFQCFEVVLGRPHAAEAHGSGDLGLRRRNALGLDALGDQGEDGALGVGDVH